MLSQDPHEQVEIVSKLIEIHKTSGGIEDLITEYEAKLTEKAGGLDVALPCRLNENRSG